MLTASRTNRTIDGDGRISATAGRHCAPLEAATMLARELGPLVAGELAVVSARATELTDSYLGSVVLRDLSTPRCSLLAAVHRAFGPAEAVSGAVVQAVCPGGDVVVAGARRLVAQSAVSGVAVVERDGTERWVTDRRLVDVAAAVDHGIVEAVGESTRYFALALPRVRVAVAAATGDRVSQWFELLDAARATTAEEES